MTDSLNTTAELFSAAASLCSILVVLIEHFRRRGAQRSFRPVVGWIASLLGAAAVVATTTALLQQGVTPWSLQGRFFGVAGLAGILLCVGGAALAIFVPSMDRHLLARAARQVEQAISVIDRREGTEPGHYVDLGVRRPRSSRRAVPLPKARLENGGVTVLQGPAGAGKSAALRSLARKCCRATKLSRRPRELALFVELDRLAEHDGQITPMLVQEHLLAAVGSEATLRSTLEARLNDYNTAWRWLFVVDLGVALSPPEVDEYLDALEQLVARRPGDRAVVGVRTGGTGRQHHLEIAPPSKRKRRAMLRHRGMSAPGHRVLLQRLDTDPELTDLATNADVLTLLARHVQAVDPTATPHHILSNVVDACLREASSLGARPESVQRDALLAAFHAISPFATTPDIDPAPLVHIGLARAERGHLAFRNEVVRAHLAAAHLTQTEPPYSLEVALAVEEWRPVLIAALRSGNENFQERFFHDAVSIITDDAAAAGFDLGSVEPPPPGVFRWPPNTLRVLEILRRGVDPGDYAGLPADLREAADSLVRMGLLAGGQAQQRATTPLLPLALRPTVLMTVNRVLNKKSNRPIIAPTVEQLAHCPGFFDDLKLRTRLRLLGQTFGHGVAPLIVEQAGQARGALTSFASATRDLSRVAELTAVGLLVLATAKLWQDISHWPFALFLTVLALSYLWTSSRFRPRREGWGLPALVLLCVVVILAWSSLNIVATATTRFLDFQFATAATNLMLAWFESWPIVAVLLVALDPTANRRWLWAHKHLAQRVKNSGLSATSANAAARYTMKEHVTPRRVAAVTFAVVTYLIAVNNPPPLSQMSTDTRRFLALLVLVVIGVLLGPTPLKRSTSWRRLKWRHDHLAGLSPDALFTEFKLSFDGGGVAVQRFLAAVGQTQPGKLDLSAPLLEDFDNLLTFIRESMPDRTTTSLKEGAWRLAPPFRTTGFREWAVEFDRRRPGVLPSLAESERVRDLASNAVLTARWIQSAR